MLLQRISKLLSHVTHNSDPCNLWEPIAYLFPDWLHIAYPEIYFLREMCRHVEALRRVKIENDFFDCNLARAFIPRKIRYRHETAALNVFVVDERKK